MVSLPSESLIKNKKINPCNMVPTGRRLFFYNIGTAGGVLEKVWTEKEKVKSNKPPIDPSQLFRMPWTSANNAFSWLEITRRCDRNCGYCYQKNRPGSNKEIAQVERDLQILRRLRKCDTVFVSGGEPLLHPNLPEVIQKVSDIVQWTMANIHKVCTNE